MSDPYRKDDIRKSPEELERIAASLCDTPDEMEGDAPDTITQLRARIKALESAQGARVPEGWVLVPKVALEWLFGEAPDKGGRWFQAEKFPEATGAYWWRSVFRNMINAAAPPAPSAPSREPMTEAERKAIERELARHEDNAAAAESTGAFESEAYHDAIIKVLRAALGQEKG